MHQPGVECGQTGSIAEQEVGGIFAGAGRPVVGLSDRTADFGMQRMGLVEQPTQHARPVGAQLFIQQGLGAGGFLHPDKAVVTLAVG